MAPKRVTRKRTPKRRAQERCQRLHVDELPKSAQVAIFTDLLMRTAAEFVLPGELLLARKPKPPKSK